MALHSSLQLRSCIRHLSVAEMTECRVSDQGPGCSAKAVSSSRANWRVLQAGLEPTAIRLKAILFIHDIFKLAIEGLPVSVTSAKYWHGKDCSHHHVALMSRYNTIGGCSQHSQTASGHCKTQKQHLINDGPYGSKLLSSPACCNVHTSAAPVHSTELQCCACPEHAAQHPGC